MTKETRGSVSEADVDPCVLSDRSLLPCASPTMQRRIIANAAARVAAGRTATTVARRTAHSASLAPASSLWSPVVASSRCAAPRRPFSAAAAAGPTIVLADHDNKTLGESTLNTVTAARKLGGGSDLTVLVLGSGAGGAAVAAQASKVNGVSKVILVDDASFEHALAEQSATIAAIVKESGATHVLSSTSASGKNILPRLGAHLDVQPITDVIDIQTADTFVRPVYAGNAIATVQSSDKVKVLTVRPTSFEKAASGEGKASVDKKDAVASKVATKWEKEELTRSARPELASARIVVSGGRGLKSKENFVLVEALADALGGAVGASRAAVDAGYVPNDYQVGQTGKVVAPDLYIAVGISGAIQHLGQLHFSMSGGSSISFVLGRADIQSACLRLQFPSFPSSLPHLVGRDVISL